MLKLSDIKIADISPGGFDHGPAIDNRVHCKIVPHLIYARAEVGHYEITCNGQHIIMNQGEAFFTPPDTYMKIVHHINQEVGKMSARWLHFNASILGVKITSLFNIPLRVDAATCEKTAPDLERLRVLADDDCISAVLEKNELCFRFIRRLLTISIPETNLNELLNSSGRVQTATSYVRRNMKRNIKVADLAKACAMSPPAFFRYFSLTLKTTPQKFISRLKMEHAAELLRDSRLSVADVADATGFANQFHFSRCFKRYYGTAPGKYRDSNIWKFADI
jgi:AraC-like DNA-binding protein